MGRANCRAACRCGARGYFGSYARGDWGVGSDVDVLVLVRVCQTPFERRGILWNAMDLPVHADVLVYTLAGMGIAGSGESMAPNP